jgi:hypothetical protein
MDDDEYSLAASLLCMCNTSNIPVSLALAWATQVSTVAPQVHVTAAVTSACRHEKELKELKEQQAAAAASAQAAAEEAAAKHKQQMEQLHVALEEQGAAAAAQVAAMQQQAGQMQERLTSVSQQLLSVLQLPQGLIQQQQQQHQQYQVMSVGGIVNATAGTPGSPQHVHSPGAAARLSMSPNAQQQQQQQQQGLQQGSAAAPLLQEAVQLSSALSSSLTSNPNTSPEEAAGAVQVLVLGLGQQLQAFAEQLVLLQQENQQLQEDGIALAGDFEACATNLQSLVATVAFSIPVGEEVQQGLNSRDAAVFDETLAALHEVRGALLCIGLLCCCSFMLLCTAGLPDACSFMGLWALEAARATAV